MNEAEARAWIHEEFGASASAKLSSYVDFLIDASATQNLISHNSKDQVWSRHIADSAQLVVGAPASGLWIDIGTGAGLPGIVVAICRDEPVMLVEPRRLRTEFLNRAVAHLGLATQVMQMKVESLALPNAAVVISARAVGRLDALFNAAVHLADSATHWILPKGNSAEMEVESARKSWHGVFHVKPSISDPAAGIVHAHGVCRR